MEAFFFGYQAFTAKADEMLARRGLSRVHQRIVFFIAHHPGVSVKELLSLLGVSKQALNTPLRQLIEMNLVRSVAPETDKRKRLLELTVDGEPLTLGSDALDAPGFDLLALFTGSEGMRRPWVYEA